MKDIEKCKTCPDEKYKLSDTELCEQCQESMTHDAVLCEVRANYKGGFEMEEIAMKFRKWKKENPDEDYQYDEIHDFMSELSRGELLEVFEYLDKIIK